MTKLIRLELRKLKWRNLLLWAAVADLLIALWVLGSDFPSNGIRTYDRAFASIASYVGLVFLVFAGVLMAKIVIDEYRNKTVAVLYSYPVPRRSIMTAKLVVVGGWTFLSTLLSNASIVALFLWLNESQQYVATALTGGRAAEELARMLIFAAGAAGISMIPLYFGMLRKTMPAMLVSAFVLSNIAISITNNDESALYQSVPLVALLNAGWLVLGGAMGYASIRLAERSDVL